MAAPVKTVFRNWLIDGRALSQKIMERIFQLFFTTEPAVKGTGLDLSLSHDIFQAHGVK
jgi:signal transduction histidine kinase